MNVGELKSELAKHPDHLIVVSVHIPPAQHMAQITREVARAVIGSVDWVAISCSPVTQEDAK